MTLQPPDGSNGKYSTRCAAWSSRRCPTTMSSPGRRSWLSAGTFTSDSGDGRPAWIPSPRLFVVPEPKHPGPIRPGVPPGALANTEGRSPGPLQQLQNYALATRREHNWSVVASPSTRTAILLLSTRRPRSTAPRRLRRLRHVHAYAYTDDKADDNVGDS